jgi:bacterioferritin-associated ferredoxin
VMVCRCEGISAGELRASLRADFGPAEVNRLKAITRCGMGRCQGRFCALAAAELTAQTLRLPLEAVGRLRAQPPVKPLPLAINPAGGVPAAGPDGTSAPA